MGVCGIVVRQWLKFTLKFSHGMAKSGPGQDEATGQTELLLQHTNRSWLCTQVAGKTAFFKSSCGTEQLLAGSSQKVWQFLYFFLQDDYRHWVTLYIRNGQNSWKVAAIYIAYKIFQQSVKCLHRVVGVFMLSEQPYSRPASAKQFCSNCCFRSIDTQTRMKDHLPVRTQQIQ